MPLNIISKTTPNFSSGRGQYKPEAIVIHIMEGTLEGTDSWFASAKSQVSAHYGIGRNGEIHQYVKESDTAWHAGRVSSPSWSGIKKKADATYINPNLYTIGIEHEGNDNSDWTAVMYDTSSQLIKEICQRFSIAVDRYHIIGHHEIYALKTCPGNVVDLGKLVEKAGGIQLAQLAPATLIGNLIAISPIRIRSGNPSLVAPVKKIEKAGTILSFADKVQGDELENSLDWFTDGQGNYWLANECKILT